jgi:hypothetical protein
MLLPELQRDRHDPHPVAGSKISRDCLSMMTLVAGLQSCSLPSQSTAGKHSLGGADDAET